jgi:predicted secreted acid phosphatase
MNNDNIKTLTEAEAERLLKIAKRRNANFDENAVENDDYDDGQILDDSDYRLKRFDVWLNERHQETVEHAKKLFGHSASTVMRAALELLRKEMNPD